MVPQRNNEEQTEESVDKWKARVKLIFRIGRIFLKKSDLSFGEQISFLNWIKPAEVFVSHETGFLDR